MYPMRPGRPVTAGRDGSPSPSLHELQGKSRAQDVTEGVEVNLDLSEGRSTDREREAGIRAVPGLFANSNCASRYEPDGPFDPEFPCMPELPCVPAAFAACLAACAAAFACKWASELVRPGLSGLTFSSES